ncbi:SpoIIE family protein phosphatase [Streptomyces sp. HNM0575]|uniref:ATP-binding SpoIIE family protein phosphatase n=1 Tax=Streptomyces sp. HNM0575 TaxID=2716338 RepID=UPI00145F2471|nr:SpoIIE family protein phosphatase [Streptomyces sp. HNM0575]NLU75314.1 SpoIIE family protein phosphatase [Streptomyces sp. HNM0575]
MGSLPDSESGRWTPTGDGTAAAVVDGDGIIVGWSAAAESLLGYAAGDLCGRHVSCLLSDPESWDGLLVDLAGLRELRNRSGSNSPVYVRVEEFEFPAVKDDSRFSLVLFFSVPRSDIREQNEALIRTLLSQNHPGLVVYNPDLSIQQAGPPLTSAVGKRPRDFLEAEDADALEDQLGRILKTGEPLVDWEHDMRPRHEPGGGTVQSITGFRLLGPGGDLLGAATFASDAVARERGRQRLDLLHQVMANIGVSLDVARTSEALVKVLVPDFASWAAVDLAAAVLDGDQLPDLEGPWPARQRQAATAQARDDLHIDLARRARVMHETPETPRTRVLRQGQSILTPDLSVLFHGEPEQAAFLRSIYPEEARSVIVAPLYTREGLLGVLGLARTADTVPFNEEDLALVEEITPRAALNMTNAWRFAHEHRTAVALQRSLLPRPSTKSTAAETAGIYVSAGVGAGVSGDWYDIIPLSSLRSAFVVGDVVGHGLQATAMMGRLRTAVQSFADLDLDPEELLSRLDDLVLRAAAEQETASGSGEGSATGATCLYAVYDPVSRRCVLASAGHPPPALAQPDGTVGFVGLDPGPPLGIGGMPFETTELELAPGSVLALYTDGLVARRQSDMGVGMEKLRREVGDAALQTGTGLQDLSRDVVTAMMPAHPVDDATLLLTRTHAVPAANTAFWELPKDDEAVAQARTLVTRQLTAWGLDELVFTVEIVASELVTNAIRYGGSPIGLRLLHDKVLVCEVTDSSDTQPRMRRARSLDEGGRGLFIAAQLTQRWGSRSGRYGKTIWVELALPEGT